MVCSVSKKSRMITPFLSQKTGHITSPAEDYILNLFFNGSSQVFSNLSDSMILCHCSMDYHFDSGLYFWHHISSVAMMRSRKLTPSTLCWFSSLRQTEYIHTVCIQCSFCKHTWDVPDTNFVIIQHCHNHFQCIESNIQLHTQLTFCNPLIQANEQIEMIFILRCDSCAWLSRMWLVFHVTVTTAVLRQQK